jgi:hypothetical protein
MSLLGIPMNAGVASPLTSIVSTLHVNSLLDGQTYDNLTQWNVFLNSFPINGAKHMELINFQIANYVKQFHSLKTNFVFIYNGIASSISIDTGSYYDSSSIITELNNKFTAGGFAITASYITASQRLSFAVGGVGVSVRFLGQFEPDTLGNFTIINRCNAKLGFINSNNSVITSGNSGLANIPMRLNQECIYLSTTLTFTSVIPSRTDLRNVLVRIPLVGNIGDVVSFTPSQDSIFDLQLPSITEVRFAILDEDYLQPNDLVEAPCQIEIHFTA